MRNTVTKDKVIKLCKIAARACDLVLVGHTNPDGDCIGSLTAMRAFLKKAFDSCLITAVVPDRAPAYLSFLDPEEQILNYKEHPEEVSSAIRKADTIICMDFNNLKRIDQVGELIRESNAVKVLIDHHPGPERFASLIFSTTEVSSACELTYQILKKAIKILNIKELPAQTNTSLYAGMMTDTNNFSNSVFASTFKMASELTAAGVDREAIQFKILNGYSQDRMRLMGEMLLNRMKIFPQLNASLMVLDKNTQARFNYKKGDSEGFVNLPLLIGEVNISALFTEDSDYIRVSLRSKGNISVNELSHRFFNGGGHERAAGGRLYMPVDKVEEYFEKSLDEFLRHSF